MCSLELIGMAISAGGALMQGVQDKQLSDYQAKAYEQQARAEAQSAAFEQSQERHKQDLLESLARAQAGASGVGIAGSPAEVLAAKARQGQVDLNAIRYSSTLRQNNLLGQAASSRFSANQALTTSFFKAGNSFVNDLSGLYKPANAVKLGTNVFLPAPGQKLSTGIPL